MSVRSAEEARAALAGGAAVVDVKEPDRGPLGRAEPRVWAEVRAAVPPEVSVSVALGELLEWRAGDGSGNRPAFEGIAFRKLGLAGQGRGWTREWAALRSAWGEGPPWVAVAYADWSAAGAPRPDEVLDVALGIEDCAGLLVDTWDKTSPSTLGPDWAPWIRRAQEGGRFVALAGGLDEAAFDRLASLGPDLLAVRGAACAAGDRRGAVDAARVARLVRAAAAIPSGSRFAAPPLSGRARTSA